MYVYKYIYIYIYIYIYYTYIYIYISFFFVSYLPYLSWLEREVNNFKVRSPSLPEGESD